MKKFFTVIILCLISNSSFADKLNGSFFCERKFTDGSSDKLTMKIVEDYMSLRTIGFKKWEKYQKKYQIDNHTVNYKVFASDLYGMVYIVYQTKNENKIGFVEVITYTNLLQQTLIAEGTCYRV